MKFKMITAADAASFEANVNAYLAELETLSGQSITIFQPFSTDHAERFCVGVVSRDLAAEHAATAERIRKFAEESAEREKAFALTPGEPTDAAPTDEQKRAIEETVKSGLAEQGIDATVEHIEEAPTPAAPVAEEAAST